MAAPPLVGYGPRRRSELGLLLMGALVVLFAALLASLGVTGQLPDRAIEFIIGIVLIGLVVHLANRRYAPFADPVILPVVLVLNGLGYVMVSRLDPANAGNQLAWSLIGVGIYVAVIARLRRSRELDRYRYLLLLAAFVLLVSPLMPKIGEDINGARLWVHFGTLISFQPVEVAKILLVIFFASYFVEKREMLTIPTHRVGDHLLPDLRAFGPVAVAGAVALLVILAEHDIGFSLLIFVVFLSLLWVTTGRLSYIVVGLVVFALGTFLASHVLGQLNARIAIWLDPWRYYSSPPPYAGYQSVQGELAFGNGGLFGTGLGLGNLTNLPVAYSDMIFASFGEELGLVGTAAIVVAYLLLVGSGLRASLRARTEFAKLLGVGLTATLGFQAFFIMAGVVRLLPLTGVTLPFVAYGGSSLVANYALIAILMRISNEANQADSLGTPAATSTSSAATTGVGRR